MVLGLGQQFEDPRFSAQQAINLQRRDLGLDRLAEDDPDVQRAQQFSGFMEEANPLINEAKVQADVRARNTEAQLKQAGLAGAADQFRRSQRNIAFETARRGTLGGSRSIERNAEAQQGLNQDINSVLTNASQAAEQQRLSESAQAFGLEQQLASGDPFANISTQNQLASIQQRGQAATGQFDLANQREAVRSGTAMNRAGFISNALGNVGMGLGSFLDDRSRTNQLQQLSSLKHTTDPFSSANMNSFNFIGPRRQ